MDNTFNINWDGLTKKRYDSWMRNHERADDCLGNVRVGETCFDFVQIDNEDFFTVDCYVYGIDNGYATTEDGAPYDMYDGFCININEKESYEDFVKEVNNEIIHFFVYTQKEVVDHAQKPLLVW